MTFRSFLTLGLFFMAVSVSGQQLIVMRKDHVIKRFSIGDDFRYKTHDHKKFRNVTIVSLSDSTLITTEDTISLLNLAVIDIGHRPETKFKLRSSAIKMITLGVILPIGDFITVTAVQDKAYSFDKFVAVSSAALIITGGILVMLSKPHIRINRKHRIRVVNYGSPFYKN